MYRLVLAALLGYLVLGLLFALLGKLSFSATALLSSAGLVLLPAFVADRGLARLFEIPSNSESWLISGMIVLCVLQPANTVSEFLAAAVAGALAGGSKYLITWHDKHIFNPAALGIAVVSLVTIAPSTWWIGNSAFWPCTLLFGLAIVRKLRRMPLFVSFIITTVLVQIAVFVLQDQSVFGSLQSALLASPVIFLGTVMLTEPATMPPRRGQQVIFAALVAVLYVTGWTLGPLHIYPEVALLLGNLYAFAVSPKLRVRLRLSEIQQISGRVYHYVFQPDRQFSFLPGQYMEWTLPGVPLDRRGNRRTFTIASSPTEPTVQIGLKYYQPSSRYKATFFQLKPGDYIYASQLAGNFTPDLRRPGNKLAFIAGGIGITPFRSMIKYIVDQQLSCDIVLLYLVSEPAELAYQDLFVAAQYHGVRYVPLTGRLDAAQLSRQLPDFASRTFYISGPNSMVDDTKALLRKQGVLARAIKTDHFSGY